MNEESHILKVYDKHINTLESEAEGTPPIKGELPKDVIGEGKTFPSLPFKLLIWIIIISLVLAIAFLLLSSKDGQKCLSNPFVYGAKQVQSEVSGELYCSCSFTNPMYAGFDFTNNNLSIRVP